MLVFRSWNFRWFRKWRWKIRRRLVINFVFNYLLLTIYFIIEDSEEDSIFVEEDEDNSGVEEEEEEEDEDDINYEFTKSMREEPGFDSGCTAVVALLRENDLYVANAGDSRCIVSRNGL